MSLPCSNATSGQNAIRDIQNMLRQFGCKNFGTGEDYETSELFIQFEHRGRMVHLKASAKADDCSRPLTPDVEAAAKAVNLPISHYADKPDCYVATRDGVIHEKQN